MRIDDYEVQRIVQNPSAKLIQKSQEILERMNIFHKWNKSKGEGIKIGVIDTGVDVTHPELRKSIRKTYNPFNNTSDVYDAQGHGTHVAGIIFGDRLIKGVSPESELYVVKGLSDNGAGTDISIAQGVQWCIDEKVNVICMSLGSPYPSKIIENAINEAASQDIICVCAAGNSAEGNHTKISINYPAAYINTIAVGAIDYNKQIANFSSVGNVDVVSFGVNILSSYRNRNYAILSGTSMATPYIAGCIALIQSNAKNRLGRVLTLEEIKIMLILNAADLGAPGFDNIYGYGKFKF